MAGRGFRAMLSVLALTAAVSCAQGTVPGAGLGRTGTSTPVAGPASCIRSALRARFEGGGYGTGNDFGDIFIWNPTRHACVLTGRVSFVAFYRSGVLDRQAVPNRPPGSVRVVLPADMPAPRDGGSQGRYLVALLMGPERDDPGQPDALCRAQDKLAPATLVLRIGAAAFRVANIDAGSIQVRAVYGCHGQVLLEQLRAPIT